MVLLAQGLGQLLEQRRRAPGGGRSGRAGPPRGRGPCGARGRRGPAARGRAARRWPAPRGRPRTRRPAPRPRRAGRVPRAAGRAAARARRRARRGAPRARARGRRWCARRRSRRGPRPTRGAAARSRARTAARRRTRAATSVGEPVRDGAAAERGAQEVADALGVEPRQAHAPQDARGLEGRDALRGQTRPRRGDDERARRADGARDPLEHAERLGPAAVEVVHDGDDGPVHRERGERAQVRRLRRPRATTARRRAAACRGAATRRTTPRATARSRAARARARGRPRRAGARARPRARRGCRRRRWLRTARARPARPRARRTPRAPASCRCRARPRATQRAPRRRGPPRARARTPSARPRDPRAARRAPRAPAAPGRAPAPARPARATTPPPRPPSGSPTTSAAPRGRRSGGFSTSASTSDAKNGDSARSTRSSRSGVRFHCASSSAGTARPANGCLPAAELVQRHPERVEVGGRRQFLAAHLLRGHVEERPGDRARPRERRPTALEQPRDPEVHQPHAVVRRVDDDHVLRASRRDGRRSAAWTASRARAACSAISRSSASGTPAEVLGEPPQGPRPRRGPSRASARAGPRPRPRPRRASARGSRGRCGGPARPRAGTGSRGPGRRPSCGWITFTATAVPAGSGRSVLGDGAVHGAHAAGPDGRDESPGSEAGADHPESLRQPAASRYDAASASGQTSRARPRDRSRRDAVGCGGPRGPAAGGPTARSREVGCGPRAPGPADDGPRARHAPAPTRARRAPTRRSCGCGAGRPT